MNNKGVILVAVLWVLLILSLIAWGLGRRSSLEVSLLETYRGKLRSYAAARAGMNKILDLMQTSPSSKDTLYATAISIDQTKSPADIFSHIDIAPNAYVTLQWSAKNFNTPVNKPHLEYGIRDERGRINVNAMSPVNYQILSALLQLQGLSQSNADKLALAIINYTGTGTSGNNGSFLNMDHSLLKPKNKPYENLLELLEVNGMTQEIFNKIKDDLTVYGDTQSGLWINTDTANNDVIQAVANASARMNPSINAGDIIREAYTIRDGADAQSFSSDDGTSSIAAIADPNWPQVLEEGKSDYYRVRVVGVDEKSGVRTVLEAVIHWTPQAAGEIISWQRV
ncbi:MAG: general secretion pathway protein GspK [Candidatus Omnitrophica bacterium]|nr:general secretion pathway protein GspK [Candidatus Omnitrophota bacterium]